MSQCTEMPAKGADTSLPRRRTQRPAAALTLLCAATLACAAQAAPEAAAAKPAVQAASARGAVVLPPVTPGRERLRVLSGRADQVTGGDARVVIDAPAATMPLLSLWLNGAPIAPTFVTTSRGREAVVTGLNLGPNTLEVRMASNGTVRDRLTLVNHPVTGPIFSGPQQHPFVCTTIQGGITRQPRVDTPVPPGYTVRDAAGNVIGYSRDCSIDTFVTYLYRRNTGGSLVALPAGARPADMGTTTLPDGRTVDFIVRREVGSINRFLYSIAMLSPAPAADNAAQNDSSLWSGKLLYWFQGGVAIGHSQGTVHSGSLNPDVLGQGMAIVHSSGNNTGTHYNMNLAGETALMTKERFVERHGVPTYTVGLGGSGGAIQQYLIAQNHPGVLDGLLPVQSYPDMVTQTIHVGDCELLEHYMDATDRSNPKWQVTKNRSWLVGMNAEEGFTRVNDALRDLKLALGYASAVGSTECIPAWRGLTPLTLNPLFGQVPNQQFYEPQSAIAAIRWTHYDDVRNVYGVDETGAARITMDNVGVQYGLKSLQAGRITPVEFLHLNWYIGSFKHPSDMLQETFPFFGTSSTEINKALTIPGYFDPWSRKNMRLGSAETPAPRAEGSLPAQRAVYSTGHVFDGRLNVPAIDHRQYMERELDMHNSHQSFAVRQRVQNRMGHSDNLVIWFTDTIPETPKVSQTLQALAVMDQWLMNIRSNPKKTVAQNKPAMAADACFDRFGSMQALGTGVWAGVLDTLPAGACTAQYPLYSTSRIVAGAPITGDMYRCARKSVATAVADGTYTPWMPSAEQVVTLNQIFTGGVCDYSQPDQARPELVSRLR